MLFCDACDKGYHMDCHKPKVKDKPSGILIDLLFLLEVCF